ncbi:MAG: cytochrome c nitrite reductase small subunit [Candidatus Marinimicrobia bacterium]|nr:cytochrome c nitrite reductase small subunit [Candidatus Neomarinimicrobiota bacterium]
MVIKFKILINLVLVIFFLFILVFFWPVNLYHKTSTPEFCAACHDMDGQYEAWMKTAVHRSIACVECHLPHSDPVTHFFWKGYDGMKDVIFFYGRLYEDPIIASNHGVKTIQKNCLRCHQEMVSNMTLEDRTCWSCHRRINHNFPATGNEILISRE